MMSQHDQQQDEAEKEKMPNQQFHNYKFTVAPPIQQKVEEIKVPEVVPHSPSTQNKKRKYQPGRNMSIPNNQTEKMLLEKNEGHQSVVEGNELASNDLQMKPESSTFSHYHFEEGPHESNDVLITSGKNSKHQMAATRIKDSIREVDESHQDGPERVSELLQPEYVNSQIKKYWSSYDHDESGALDKIEACNFLTLILKSHGIENPGWEYLNRFFTNFVKENVDVVKKSEMPRFIIKFVASIQQD